MRGKFSLLIWTVRSVKGLGGMASRFHLRGPESLATEIISTTWMGDARHGISGQGDVSLSSHWWSLDGQVAWLFGQEIK